MLEIIVLILLCKHIGERVRSAGRKPFRYQVLMVCLWFGGEMAGGFTGVFLCELLDIDPGLRFGVTYGCAIGGAVLGAFVAFAIAKRYGAAPEPAGFPVMPMPSVPVNPSDAQVEPTPLDQ